MKLVLFDCDGTLVDSAGVIHDCMKRTFADAGLALPTDADTRQIIGLSLNVAIERLLAGRGFADIPGLVALYKDRGRPDFHEALFEGISPMLEEMHRRDDLLLGMVTGKSRRGVSAVVATHRLDDLFVVVRTADDCPSKPNPEMVLECCAETGIEPAETVVIGDTAYDMEMALSAGARAIGVSWGYHDSERLLAAGAVEILRTPGELTELI
jgi:phosphoglycolate phosphatase